MNLTFGTIIGGVVGAILAVNLIITAGIGYDVTLVDVFEENAIIGSVTTAILVAGPIIGVAIMRRLLHRGDSALPGGRPGGTRPGSRI